MSILHKHILTLHPCLFYTNIYLLRLGVELDSIFSHVLKERRETIPSPSSYSSCVGLLSTISSFNTKKIVNKACTTLKIDQNITFTFNLQILHRTSSCLRCPIVKFLLFPVECNWPLSFDPKGLALTVAHPILFSNHLLRVQQALGFLYS